LNILLLLGILFLLPCTTTLARIPETVDQGAPPDWVQVDQHILPLNGRGTHELLIFKVYEASLYLENKSNDPEKIISSKGRKALVLKFFRGVSADQLRAALDKDFMENCGDKCERFQPSLDLIASRIPDLNEGDTLTFHFLPSLLILKSSDGKELRIEDSEFPAKFLKIWLGPSPPSNHLKDRLLGLP
jgi:hypothetical protein